MRHFKITVKIPLKYSELCKFNAKTFCKIVPREEIVTREGELSYAFIQMLELDIVVRRRGRRASSLAGRPALFVSHV